jgi:hypothetical protein
MDNAGQFIAGEFPSGHVERQPYARPQPSCASIAAKMRHISTALF